MQPAPGTAQVVLVLTLLLGIQPVTTDVYLPALPALTADLEAPMGAAQLTLSALIICFGVGQLVCGPLADRHGRRPVLLWGLCAYTATSVLAVFAPDIEWLIAARAAQGFAMAAAVTCARAIVRDLYEPHEGARVLSRALTGLGVIAMLGPLAGGAVATWFDWRAALLLVSVFGVLTLAVIAMRFRETAPRLDARATHIPVLASNWRGIAGHPGFRAYAALAASTYGGLYTLLAAGSFVFIDMLGTSSTAYGGLIALASASYIAGTVCCRRLLARGGLQHTVAIGGFLSLTGGLAMLASALAGAGSVWAYALPQCVYVFAHGIHQPCAQVGAIGPFPEKAGSAAALSGFVMMCVAFAAGIALGQWLEASVLPMALGVASFGTLSAALAWTAVRRHGAPPVARLAGAA